MHSQWPSAFSSVALVAAWPVIVLRLLTVELSTADRQLAAIIGFGLVNCTLREPNAQRLLSAATGGHLSVLVMYQLSVVAFAVSTAAAVLFTRGLSGRPPPRVLLGASTALWFGSAVVLGLAEDPEGVVRGVATGPAAFAYYAGGVALPILAGAEMFALGVAGVNARGERLEAALHAMVAGVGCVSAGQGLSRAVTAVLLGTGHAGPITEFHSWVDNDLCLPAVLAGVVFYAGPLARSLSERAGIDEWSRRRRLLHPLWSDLTAACPEIVFHAAEFDGRDPLYRLHRTVVEIRDCMLILHRYAPPDPVVPDGPPRAGLESALVLARAVHARRGGARPVAATGRPRAVARDLMSEIEELAALAAVWRKASALAASEFRAGGYAGAEPRFRGMTWFGDKHPKSPKRPI